MRSNVAKRARYVSLRFRCRAVTVGLRRIERYVDAEDRRQRAAPYAYRRRRHLESIRESRDSMANAGTFNGQLMPMYETLSGRRIQATECKWLAPWRSHLIPLLSPDGPRPPVPWGRRRASPR